VSEDGGGVVRVTAAQAGTVSGHRGGPGSTRSAEEPSREESPITVSVPGPQPSTTTPTTPSTSTGRSSGGGLPRRGGSPAAAPRSGSGPYADDQAFLDEQRQALLAERETYRSQAETLRAEAESLALEREPGDVQFDEESGEGGTVAVDRERDLQLSAQAMAAIEEIDLALAAVEAKTYGACERCGQPIPKARLRALPFARLCIACKSGGLHRR
jgi:DnaK suppressor protein